MTKTLNSSSLIYSALLAGVLILTGGCSKQLEQDHKNLTLEYQALEKKKNDIQILNENQKVALLSAQGNLESALKEVSTLKVQNTELQEDATEAKIQLGIASEKAKSLEARIASLQADLDSFKREIQAQSEVTKQREAALRKGEILGSVSYYFNANYGYKPDNGSSVMIWEKTAYSKFNPERFRAVLRSEQAVLKEEAEAATKMVMDVEFGKMTIKATADGTGAFARKVSPGNYYVLIRSAHRERTTLLEVTGKLALFELEVAADEQKSVEAKFHVY